MIESERIVGEKNSQETRYFISSLKPNVQTFAQAARGHWSIENNLHWVLDVQMNEDQSRLRKAHSAENFSILRRMALNFLKGETSKKRGIKAKSKNTSWNHQYLLKVLFGIPFIDGRVCKA